MCQPKHQVKCFRLSKYIHNALFYLFTRLASNFNETQFQKSGKRGNNNTTRRFVWLVGNGCQDGTVAHLQPKHYQWRLHSLRRNSFMKTAVCNIDEMKISVAQITLARTAVNERCLNEVSGVSMAYFIFWGPMIKY